MREIPESEAKTRLPDLLTAVEQGATVAITRDGRAVAHLAPASEPTPPATTPQPTIAELRAETPAENYQRWLEARGPISESLQEFLDWRSYGRR